MAGPGTGLAQKLGLGPGVRAWFLNVPAAIGSELERAAPSFHRLEQPEPPVQVAVLFVNHCAALDCELRMLLPLIADDATIWISWPTPEPGLSTGLDADVVRELARPLHLVAAEVGPIGDGWEGLGLTLASQC